jgi:hypothetical protein
MSRAFCGSACDWRVAILIKNLHFHANRHQKTGICLKIPGRLGTITIDLTGALWRGGMEGSSVILSLSCSLLNR